MTKKRLMHMTEIAIIFIICETPLRIPLLKSCNYINNNNINSKNPQTRQNPAKNLAVNNIARIDIKPL
jgi:hypothetical protein